MKKKYLVELTDEKRSTLREVVRKLKDTSQKVRRANILLKADACGPGRTDAKIAEAFDCRTNTVENVRQRFVELGVDVAINGKKREPPQRKNCSMASKRRRSLPCGLVHLRPAMANGRCGCWPARWWNWRLSIRSVTKPCVERKKNGMGTQRAIQYWVIPPEADAEFVAHMEDVLDVYSRPYDATVPVLCMDEQPVQWVEEVRYPIEATKDHPRRVDYEYKRAGVANIFMFAEPLAGWRHVSVRERKTKVDWAIEMADLLNGRDADCERVIVVCDNLNTHAMGAFYEAFEPARARSLVSRVEFHDTPKHGSWLNIAENELSSMTRQCVAG